MSGPVEPRSIAGRAAIMMVVAGIMLMLVGKLGALLKDIALAFFFGAGPQTDAYFIANIIPALTWTALYSTIAAVFLPIYIAERERSPSSGAQIATEAVRLYVWAGLAMMILTWILAGPIVTATAPDATPEVKALAITLIRIISLSFGITGFVGVQNALQQANGAYLWPLSVAAINNTFAILAIMVAAWLDNIAIAVAGATLAWFLQAPIQRWQTRGFYPAKVGWRIRPETVRRIALLSWPIGIGIFLDQANIFIGIAIAGRFDEGAVSYVSYASRLALFIGNLVSWLVAYFLFPRIATFAARGQDAQAGRELGLGIVLIVGLTAPLLALAVSFGTDIIRLVYARGAFGEESVRITAMIFVPFAFGTVFMGLRELINRAFFSYQRTKTPMMIGAVAALTNLGLGIFLAEKFGLPGIAVAASISALVFVTLQVAVILRWKPDLLNGAMVRQSIALTVAAGAGLVLGMILANAMADWGFLARLAVGGTAVGSAYLVASYVLDRVFALGLLKSILSIRGSSTPDPDGDPTP